MAQKPEPTPQTPARRFTDTVESFGTVIGPGTTVRGELSGEDSVDVYGTLEGDTHLTAHCVVRSEARVSGPIEAKSLVVRGAVEASSLAAEKIEIGPEARVRADLHARVVAIAEGARFDGRVQMGGSDSGSAPTVFKERRGTR